MTSFLVSLVFISSVSYGHSGRTNAEGCHNNRKIGEYHCHNKKTKKVVVSDSCCKICKKGKACGDSCVAIWKECNIDSGCACDKER